MNAVCKTHPGTVRTNNEDNVLIDPERGIFILADGMGGHQAGEVASDIAVKTVYQYLMERAEEKSKKTPVRKHLVLSLFKADNAIKAAARENFNLNGMGTTLVIMVVKHHTATICNIGDSRAYLIRNGAQQLTRDQTMGDYLVEHSKISRDKVPPHLWHTLTQVVGATDNLVPALHTVKLHKGDILLLCSDGLTNMVSDDEIEKTVLLHNGDLSRAAEKLIECANKNGGADNISVVLVEYQRSTRKKKTSLTKGH
jgi:protein phosphatase